MQVNYLYFIQGVEDIDVEERRARESEGKDIDTKLKYDIEGIILKWSYQVCLGCVLEIIIRCFIQTEEVFAKDSAEELEKGNNPGPMTEVEFWEAKCENLEQLFEQVSFSCL